MSTRAKLLTLVLVAGLAAFSLTGEAAARKMSSSHESAARGGDVHPLLGARRGAPDRSFLPFADPAGLLGSSLLGAAPVGNGPAVVALNPATHTIYVANGENPNGPNALGNTVSVIDSRHCNAQDISRCKGPWPTITVGNLPSGIAIDQRTDTVYVSDLGDNTVSVFNGATCNARYTAGCGQTPATVPVGTGPIQIFADPDNRTVYVATFGNNGAGNTDVSMINSATCNATDLAACPHIQPPTVNVGAAPQAVDVDPSNHTVYVTTFGVLNGWSVFDANTCNATIQSGCGSIGYLPGDSVGPFSAEVDTSNDTLYTANWDNTISAFDLAGCNASDLSGCATDTPGTVTPFPDPGFGEHDLWLAIDAPLHTVYVAYQKDDALVVIDANRCNGSRLAACATLAPPEIHTGSDPESVVLDPRTQTLYTANEVDNNVSVIDATRCSAHTTIGCRPLPPAVALSEAGALATDQAAHTVYVTSGANAVTLLNTQTCSADRPTGCDQTPPTTTVGDNPSAIAVDRRTHTVYVANAGAGSTGTITVIDSDTCNAASHTGCAHLSTLEVPGGHPDDLAVNPATQTIYVATTTAGGPNLISVFNGATCNATNTTGCQQAPALLQVGDSGGGQFDSALNIALDKATNTIYATNVVYNAEPFLGNSVYVINGATCDAVTTAGCGQTPATITIAPNPPIGSNPWGIAVDQKTDTIYTANIADGEHAGTLSVINGAICNGHDAAGCSQTPASVAAGFGAVGVAVDRASDMVFVTNTEDATVSVIDGTTCNATNTTGCTHTHPKIAVGDYPGAIAVDPTLGTAYVQNIEGVSVIPLNR